MNKLNLPLVCRISCGRDSRQANTAFYHTNGAFHSCMPSLKEHENRIDASIKKQASELAKLLDEYRSSNTWRENYESWDDALQRSLKMRLAAMDKSSESETNPEILYGLLLINRAIIRLASELHSATRN